MPSYLAPDGSAPTTAPSPGRKGLHQSQETPGAAGGWQIGGGGTSRGGPGVCLCSLFYQTCEAAAACREAAGAEAAWPQLCGLRLWNIFLYLHGQVSQFKYILENPNINA